MSAARLPDPDRLARLVNQHGTAHVAAMFRVSRDSVSRRLRRAGYSAGQGARHGRYTKENAR